MFGCQKLKKFCTFAGTTRAILFASPLPYSAFHFPFPLKLNVLKKTPFETGAIAGVCPGVPLRGCDASLRIDRSFKKPRTVKKRKEGGKCLGRNCF
jgi:hypothetical protein